MRAVVVEAVELVEFALVDVELAVVVVDLKDVEVETVDLEDAAVDVEAEAVVEDPAVVELGVTVGASTGLFVTINFSSSSKRVFGSVTA